MGCTASEDHKNWSSTLSGKGGSTKASSKRVSTKLVNMKMTLTKDFNAGLLAIKDQNGTQSFIYQFNLDAQGNRWAWYRFTDSTSKVKLYPHFHQIYPYNCQAG